MSGNRIHPPLQHRPLGRNAAVCVLMLALLWAQSLGLWHSAVHGDAQHHGARSAMAQATAHEPGQAPSLLQRLFAGHPLDTDCQFFDQHSHGDILSSAAAAAAVLALSAPALVTSHALAVARWHALFQARGPPPLR